MYGLLFGQEILFQDLKWEPPTDDAHYEEVISNQGPMQASVPWEQKKHIKKKNCCRKKKNGEVQAETKTLLDEKRKSHWNRCVP